MRIVRILVVALVAGCAVLPAKEGPPIAAIGIEPRAAAPAPPAQSQSAAVVHAAPAKAPASVAAVPPPAKAPATVVAASPPAKAPAGVAAAAPAIPPIARKPEPPLDMAALKARLRATNAIGVFTKLALKNQVDDLLERFRAHHQSGQKTGVASLRPPYDMLVLKVLAVVQDGDPSLARTISGSREAIWEILADPQKFNAAA